MAYEKEIRPIDVPLFPHLAVDEISQWSYYDNYQHVGRYDDENSLDYGPIKVYNATVFVNDRVVFRGDISQRRWDFLKKVAKEHAMKIRVQLELSEDCFFVFYRDGRVRYYSGIDKMRSKIVNDIGNRKRTDDGSTRLGALFE